MGKKFTFLGFAPQKYLGWGWRWEILILTVAEYSQHVVRVGS